MRAAPSLLDLPAPLPRKFSPGRPPKTLTEERLVLILEQVALGLPAGTAAAAVGVPRRTFQDWLRRGREPGAKEPYRSALERIEAAQALFQASQVREIVVAATRDARHAEWLLERRFPGTWGRVERVEATLTARPFIDASKLSLQEQATLLELLRKAAPAQEELPPEGRGALELVAGDQP